VQGGREDAGAGKQTNFWNALGLHSLVIGLCKFAEVFHNAAHVEFIHAALPQADEERRKNKDRPINRLLSMGKSCCSSYSMMVG